jgi:co-chaperonin GroES (HSP10)
MNDTNMNDWYIMHNKNVLVSLKEDRKVLNNGISVQDTRGRKDIVMGTVECSHPSLKFSNRALVWFPMYAGLPIQVAGNQYLVVNYDDIIMSEKVSE